MDALTMLLVALPALVIIGIILILTNRVRMRQLRRRAEVHTALVAETKEAEASAPAPAEEMDRGAEPELPVRVHADDTLETLTVRILETYEEHGSTLSVAQARSVAGLALSKRDELAGRPLDTNHPAST